MVIVKRFRCRIGGKKKDTINSNVFMLEERAAWTLRPFFITVIEIYLLSLSTKPWGHGAEVVEGRTGKWGISEDNFYSSMTQPKLLPHASLDHHAFLLFYCTNCHLNHLHLSFACYFVVCKPILVSGRWHMCNPNSKNVSWHVVGRERKNGPLSNQEMELKPLTRTQTLARLDGTLVSLAPVFKQIHFFHGCWRQRKQSPQTTASPWKMKSKPCILLWPWLRRLPGKFRTRSSSDYVGLLTEWQLSTDF